MAISQLYPNQRPTLNLNFARSKTLDPRITFTRSSTATYVGSDGLIKTAAANEARFDHNGNGDSLGLLIEESRTNLTLHSEDFTNAAWSHGAETLHSANQAVAPDGTTTADLIYPNSTGFARDIFQNYGNASGTYTVSVFAKAAGRNFIYVYNAQGNAKAWFNLSTGTKGSADAGIDDYDIIDYGNGWYRCYVRTNSTTARYFYLAPADADNSTEVTASGTNGIYVWGAQFEEGIFPTSYIPTSGSTVTRNAEIASMTDVSFINLNEATHCVISKYEYNNVWIGLAWVTSTNNGNQAYDVYYGPNTSSSGAYVATKIGQLVSSTTGVSAPSGVYKTAHAGGTGINRAKVNGITSTTFGSQTFPITSPTHLYFGSLRGIYYWLNGHINRVSFYSLALSEDQLEAITR